ncbi:hypothetical protein QBC33DRAFT_313487 [Phialemonium atrogriseum]|uniref:BTB domain-containing protein n=1 Tax=Phialemonium atrogriseum TaxID=1093897 RepID=A0AAJ0C720_9PEZI|nr:uncharacterized protein QBC33DRAFT_313487 [Phialemonium atrogriseum]KAK1770178.1 hypothetical protein QBC33DRAFT_313487 [Phialemonium atrogriseum]
MTDMSETYFDPDGDLRLEVGPDKANCVVCSRTLSRASAVWKKMLNGPFLESRPRDGEWIVELPEDDYKALTLVLNILHFRFDRIPDPTTLTVDELFNLTILTDKYDLAHLLRPWVRPLSGSLLSQDHDLRLLWIAWELGHMRLFRDIAERVLSSAFLDQTGSLCYQTAGPLKSYDYINALGILDGIEKTRATRTADMVECLRVLYQRFIDGNPGASGICKHAKRLGQVRASDNNANTNGNPRHIHRGA